MPDVVKPIIAIPALPPIGRTFLAELIGTYILVYVITQTNDLYQKSDLAGLAIGLTLTSLVFSLAHHNSGVFNPAVSLGLYLLGFLTTTEFFSQVAAQLLGGFFAGLTSLAFFGGGGYPVCAPSESNGGGIGKAFVAEFIGTSILVITVTQVAASKQRENHFFGLAIGLTVLGQAIASGKWSGGSFNPAVTTALQVVKCIGGECSHLKFWPLYVFAELLGSIVAFVFFCLTGSYAKEEGTHDREFEEDVREHGAYSRISTADQQQHFNKNRHNNNDQSTLKDSNYGAVVANDSGLSLGERKNITSSSAENERLLSQ